MFEFCTSANAQVMCSARVQMQHAQVSCSLRVQTFKLRVVHECVFCTSASLFQNQLDAARCFKNRTEHSVVEQRAQAAESSRPAAH